MINDMTNSQRREPIDLILHPFQRMEKERAQGVILLLCTVAALVWANSPWSASYTALWEKHLVIGFPGLSVEESLLHWINDGLMALFFFFVGLEIKREVLCGELGTLRKAMLPIAGAIGGMLVPALIYAALNGGREGEAGWGIPMATDIAFALGILGLMGKRIASWLPVFLAALAIADDLGAVVVIAMFYTAAISWASLGVAALVLGLLMLLNRLGVRSTLAYALPGIVVWLAMLHSGIHATIAGVLVAMTIPARTRIDGDEFVAQGHRLLGEFDRVRERLSEKERSDDQDAVVHALEHSCDQVQTPLGRMEHGLTIWISFVVLPLFAFANAGVALSGDAGTMLTNRVTLGVAVALPLGKALGITLFCWLAVRLKLGALPEGARWSQLRGAAWLGGIGFTMSLFIAGLAFADGTLLGHAKLGILAGSLLSGVIGWMVLRRGSDA